LGRNVTGKKVAPYPLASAARRIVAAFEAEDASSMSVCVFDLALVAYAGAALAMIPAGNAKEQVAAGHCEGVLLENFTEILNICRQVFQGPGRHILSPRLYLTKQEIPPHIAQALSAPKTRVDAEINIPGYGCGQLSIVNAIMLPV